MSYPIPSDDDERLKVLHSLNILDTLPEKEYDNITKLVAYICDVPIALVTLVDDKRQWFKSVVGLDVDQTPRDQAFCSYTIAQETPLVVEDATKDERFKTNQLVMGDPNIRFYAGTQIKAGDKNMGSLCVIDRKPRKLTEKQIESLHLLGELVTSLLEHKRFESISCSSLEQVQKLYSNLQIQQQVNSVKSAILTNISHEIKTPMNGIVAYVDAMSDKVSDDVLLKTLRLCTDDMMTVFSNLMDLNEEGSISLKSESIQLEKYIQHIVDNYSIKALEKLITLDYIPRLPFKWIENGAYLDANRLMVIMSNLLSNAVKFTPPHGKITVKSETRRQSGKDTFFYFEVQDSGIGIPPEYSKNIFAPLSQVDMTSTKEYRGLGNGLAVTKKIVDAFKGTIDYRSEVGKGSTFWFMIPMKEVAVETFEKLSLKSALVVDDNPLNLTIACTLVKKLIKGIKLEKAVNGLEAVKKVTDGNYDLVFMDCQMPIMDGFDATEEIRKFNDKVIIVALTASSEKSDELKCRTVGMNDLLAKPVTLTSMKDKVGKWFQFV